MNLTPFKNEKYLNFALSTDRQSMEKALAKVRGELGKFYRLGDAKASDDRPQKVLKSVNPHNPQEVIGSVAMANLDDSEKALQVVYEGSTTWKKVPVEKRIETLEKFADWMLERKEELSAWMVLEVGKSWREADADTCEAIDFCRYYSREMLRLSSPRVTQVVQGEHDTLTYHPKGVAVVIAPWNFPLAILTGMTVASLVTGNTVIIKPAEQSSIIAAKMVEGLVAAGFPQNSFYFLPGDGEQMGPKLVSDARVDLIAFTGSAAVGLSIIESAAKKPSPHQRGVKKVIAEMGGKNALIIDEDADLDEALVASVHSAFGFQGQKCSALSRLLVDKRIADSFVPRFVEAARSLKIGDPASADFQIGPVVDEEAQGRILKTIAEAKKRGVKVLYEASGLPTQGYYVPPTIFEVNDLNDPLFQNEIFGPVVAVLRVDGLEEAVRVANSVPYALTGGLFSRSPSHIDYVKKEMEVGNLYINRAITGAIVERHPFGGFKMSGVGSKAGGPDYLLQFLEPRTCAENTVRRGFAGQS